MEVKYKVNHLRHKTFEHHALYIKYILNKTCRQIYVLYVKRINKYTCILMIDHVSLS